MCLTICATCFRKLEGKIVFQDDKVFLLKRCPEHGAERVLVADDVDYYRRCREVSPEARNSDFTRAFGWALGPALLLGVLAALFGTVWLIVALLLHVFYFLKTKSRD